jgi:hypothetical protein
MPFCKNGRRTPKKKTIFKPPPALSLFSFTVPYGTVSFDGNLGMKMLVFSGQVCFTQHYKAGHSLSNQSCKFFILNQQIFILNIDLVLGLTR